MAIPSPHWGSRELQIEYVAHANKFYGSAWFSSLFEVGIQDFDACNGTITGIYKGLAGQHEWQELEFVFVNLHAGSDGCSLGLRLGKGEVMQFAFLRRLLTAESNKFFLTSFDAETLWLKAVEGRERRQMNLIVFVSGKQDHVRQFIEEEKNAGLDCKLVKAMIGNDRCRAISRERKAALECGALRLEPAIDDSPLVASFACDAMAGNSGQAQVVVFYQDGSRINGKRPLRVTASILNDAMYDPLFELRDGDLIVNKLEYRSDDALCSPSLRTEVRLHLKNGRYVRAID